MAHLTFRGKRKNHGFTYLAVIFMVFLLSLLLGKSLEIYSTTSMRSKEAELLWVGEQYKSAIRQYYLNSPGTIKAYPSKLDHLLYDPRHLGTKRYIRALYDDPITGKPFDLVYSEKGGVRGVVSSSAREAFKVSGFSDSLDLEGKKHYNEWVFAFNGP